VADHEHLPLRRVPRPAGKRQKIKRGFRREPSYPRHREHAQALDRAVAAAISGLSTRVAAAPDLNPKLMLTFALNRKIPESKFTSSGLAVLDSSDQHAAVVFSSDAEMTAFKARLEEYSAGARPPRADAADEHEDGGERSAAFEDFFDAIDGFRPLQASDRISPRLAHQLAEDPEPSLPVDVDLWFVEDPVSRAEWLAEAVALVEQRGGSWSETYEEQSARVLLGRVIAPAGTINALAELDQIALLDLAPAPRLPKDELARLQDIDRIPPPVAPPDSAPVVGIVDSGVRSGHPLLEPAIFTEVAIHSSFDGQSQDDYGHGTMIAGLVLYGDVLAAARAGAFQPAFKLASVRVLDAEGAEPERANTLRLIADAIEYLAEECECQVINLSFGDPSSPYSGGRGSALAATLDALVRRYELLVVLCAGNVGLEQLVPRTELFGRWPHYLCDPGFEIIDPAQAALAVTVGAVSLQDAPSDGGRAATAVACAGGPAPFTRHGPGIRRAIKPELAAEGGNFVFHREQGDCPPDQAVEVVSTSARYPSELFGSNVGTSFAAASITHVAGLLASAYPDLSPLMWRALLLSGARHTPELCASFGSMQGAELESTVRDIAGFGELTWERCGISEENRVILYAEDSLAPDGFHVYRVPVTESFRQTPGPRAVQVALTFNPPVRYRRLDYLGHQMEFLLVRGLDEETVFAMADADIGDVHARELTKCEIKLAPSRTTRSRGANQFARKAWSQRLSTGTEGDWFIVVRSLNKWLTGEHGLQSYALSVGIEVDRAPRLYGELEVALQAQAQARARIQS